MVKMCCEDMERKSYCIDQKIILSEDSIEDKIVYYSSKFNEYGLPIYDGENGRATSYILIRYCPWCGEKLPKSRRDEWFDCLKKNGFDTPFEDFDKIPSEFKTSEWWEKTADASPSLDEN